MGFRFTHIQDSMANKISYVDLGLACANVCTALDRGMDGRKLDDLSQSVREAIAQLTMWVKLATHSSDGSLIPLSIAERWRRSRRRSSRSVGGIWSLNFFMRRMTRKQLPGGTQTSIGSFRSSPCVQSGLIGWLNITDAFQTELVVNTHVMVSDLHRNALIGQGDNARHRSVSDFIYR